MTKVNGYSDRTQLLLSSGVSSSPDVSHYRIRSGTIVKYSRTLDANRVYATDSPTAAKFVSLLRAVDNGYTYAMHQLFEEMVAKDAHLQGVWNTRLNAVSALDWEVVPAKVDEAKQGLADKVADEIRKRLESLRSFEDCLVHLLESVATGIAISELIWKDSDVVDIVNVPFDRITQNLDTGRFQVETEKNSGIPVVEGTFVTAQPRVSPVAGFRVTLTRAQAWLYLIKHFVMADWAGFSERFGMPIPVAYADETVEPSVISDVNNMLGDLCANGHCVLPSGVTLNLMEPNRASQPYKELIELLEMKTAILFLGQTLTTQMQGTGSWAAARVHDNVRADVLLADLKAEQKWVKFGIIAPMCAMMFPGRDVPLPSFRRTLIVSRDIENERLNLDQVKAGWDMRLPIGIDELYDMLGLTKPVGDVPTVQSVTDVSSEPMASSLVEVGELLDVMKRALNVNDEEIVNVVRSKIGDCLGVELGSVVLRGASKFETVPVDDGPVESDSLSLCRKRWGNTGRETGTNNGSKQHSTFKDR